MIEACNQFEISGAGVRGIMTAHKLRGMFVTRLFELGHAPIAVAPQTRRRSLKSLDSYTIFRGTLGLRQQLDLFLSSSKIVAMNRKKKGFNKGEDTGSVSVVSDLGALLMRS